MTSRSTYHAVPTPREPGQPTGPMPCVARPHSGLVHREGPCQCFTGGPAPERVGGPHEALFGLPSHPTR